MPTPKISVVLLTWNEERNIAPALRALADQRERDFEVIVVDAASTDGTADIVRRHQAVFPVPLRLEVAPHRIPIGEARNLGVSLAQAPIVAFLSADAEAHPDWVHEALVSLATRDLVFGRQIHDPHEWTVGAAVRGLRYHFPEGEVADVLRYASNVAAAYKKEILTAHPFDPWANAAEDLLIAHRAQREGYHASYNPRMIVRHRDVATARQEMHKNVREGQGWGAYHQELGLFVGFLAWGAALLFALSLAIGFSGPESLAFFALVLWAPAIRRALLRRRDLPIGPLFLAVAASPAFDLAFLVNYVRGLFARPAPTPAKETPT